MNDNRIGARKGKTPNWGLMALTTGAVSAWLVYDIASAVEAPSRAVAVLQYFLLACGLIGFAGALVQLVSGK